MSKIKCYSVRVDSYSSRGNAIQLTAYDGSTTTVPASMVFGEDYEVQKSTAVWVAAFILEKSEGFQYSTKKVRWFDYEKQAKAEVAEQPVVEAQIGDVKVGSLKDVTGSGADSLYLFEFSDKIEEKGNWCWICPVELYSNERYRELVRDFPDTKMITIDSVDYFAYTESTSGIGIPASVAVSKIKVQGYFLEWREVRLYDGRNGRKRDTKRQHIITYSGPSNQAPKGFVELPDDEFEMAKKKEGKMIEPYTTPDFAEMIAQEIRMEEMRVQRERQAIIDEESRKAAKAQEDEDKKKAAAELAAKIEALKEQGITDPVLAWKQLGCPHPAPAAVVEAKNASGLNWKKFTETI